MTKAELLKTYMYTLFNGGTLKDPQVFRLDEMTEAELIALGCEKREGIIYIAYWLYKYIDPTTPCTKPDGTTVDFASMPAPSEQETNDGRLHYGIKLSDS